mmetsp:Transcript_22946/g.60398  ORF Transcript_22946/g.60398 Transcript_22946/m.60398 type:complete len:444 (-) Transcript_22946:157-1488(-)
MVAEVACSCAVGCIAGASIVASGGALLTCVDRRLAQIITRVVPLLLQGLRIEVEEVRLRLGRRVSVQIRSLRLLNPDGYKSECLLRADDASVTVDLFALVISACRSLGKPQDVHISDIMLRGARLYYERALRTSNVAEVLAILESLVPKTEEEEEEEEELETGGMLGHATHVVHAAKGAAISTVDTAHAAHNVVHGAVGSVVDTAPVQAATGHALAARGAVTSTAQSVAESAHGVVAHATPGVHAAVADAVGATHTAVSHAAGGIYATAQDVHHAKDVSATVKGTGVNKKRSFGGSCFSCFGGLCKRKKYKQKYSPNVHLHGVHISGLSVVPMLSARLMTFVPIGVPPIKIADLDKKVQGTVARGKNVSAACRVVLETIFSRSVEAITTTGEMPDSKLEDVNKASDSPGEVVQRSWIVNVWAGLLPCCQKLEDFQDTPSRGED